MRLTSSGTVTVRASDRLEGSLTSNGSVYYLGSLQVLVSYDLSGRAIQISD